MCLSNEHELTLHGELQLHFAERGGVHVGALPKYGGPVCVGQSDVFPGEVLQHQLEHVDTNIHFTFSTECAFTLAGHREL